MDEFLGGLLIAGVPAVIFLPALIAWLKVLGLPTSLTGAAAAIGGILVAFGIQAIKTWPEIEPWLGVVVLGVLLGLAANGAYSQFQHFVKTRTDDAAIKNRAHGGPGGTE